LEQPDNRREWNPVTFENKERAHGYKWPLYMGLSILFVQRAHKEREISLVKQSRPLAYYKLVYISH